MSAQIATRRSLHLPEDDYPPRKRQRSEFDDVQSSSTTSPAYASLSRSAKDPIIRLWHEIFDAYFNFVNPWLSILHQPSVRKGLQQVPKQRPYPRLFSAMIVAGLRFVKRIDQALSEELLIEETVIAKREALLSATDDMSIENAQILLILIYTEIADDNVHRAYLLLGIVVRHVDYLQLAVEEYAQNQSVGIFGHSHKIMGVRDWIEEEERRRLFWNVVMLDRLCSTLLGCESHFSDTRIQRRLPACASFWGTNQPQMTPYLQACDASSPGLRDSASSSPRLRISPTPDEGRKALTSGIGSLAFYVEAVESLGTVENRFLRMKVDFTNSNDISGWLMRFKEMDAFLMR